MIVARWCHRHSLVLEEPWQGLRCPAGHDWFNGHEPGPEYWVVDMEFEPSDERFCLWIIRDGRPEQGSYYAKRAALELEVTVTSDYLSKPKHWARPRRLAGRQWNFFQRVSRGKL